MYQFGEDPHSKYPALAPFVLGRHINAQYYEQSLPQARGNPLAAVIQEGRSLPELAAQLRQRITIDPDVRNLPIDVRWKRLKMDLDEVFVPRNIDLQLAERVELAMYDSLHTRNPLGSPSAFRSPETAFTLLGPAGNGKTCTIQHVLVNLFPQRITHTSFNGRPFEYEQILWMHMEAPPLGTVKQFCDTFFRYAAAILKKPYHESYTKGGRASDDRMLANMATVIANHGIALLSIDEIGRFATKGAEVERQLNALFEILNRTGIAVCLAGTFEALPLLQAHGRILGRICSHGDWIWDRPTEDNKGWEALLTAFEPVQYVHHPVKLRGDIAEAFYFETQGLARYFKVLFGLTQHAAMKDKTERITRELIHRTAQRELKLSSRMLTALRLGDRELLEDFPQMFPDLDDPFVQEIARRGQIDGALNNVPDLRVRNSCPTEPRNETTNHSFPPPDSSPKKKRSDKPRRRTGNKYQSPLRSCQGTLAQVVADGRHAHTTPTAYSVLQASGLVRTPLELLPVEQAASQASLKTEAQG